MELPFCGPRMAEYWHFYVLAECWHFYVGTFIRFNLMASFQEQEAFDQSFLALGVEGQRSGLLPSPASHRSLSVTGLMVSLTPVCENPCPLCSSKPRLSGKPDQGAASSYWDLTWQVALVSL